MDFEATYDNINALTTVTIASGDYLIVQDVNDSNNPKKGLVSDIATEAGGSDTQIQYNNGGSDFGGIADLTWDDTDLTIGATSATTKLKFRDSGLYINSSADGQLDIDADVTLEITAPTTTVAASTAINLNSDAISLGENGDTDVVVTFNANSADGVLTWMEDEDYFKFSDDVLMNSTERLNFGDTGTYINQSGDAALAVVSDGTITLDADTDIVLDANGADITFKDDGTAFVKFTQSSGDCIVTNGAADKDIIFKDAGGNEVCRVDGSAESLLVATDKKIEFRDTGLFINSSTNGQLDIDADTELEITAPTVDIDASTTVAISSPSVVIDSATSEKPEFELKNTNNDANGAILKFNKDGASAADNDVLGSIDFAGENDNGTPEAITYAQISAKSTDVSDGNEDGKIEFHVMNAGSDNTLMSLASNTVTISGDLTVNGTTTHINSTIATIEDPVLNIGGGTDGAAPGSDDNKDRGIEFQYHNGAAAKIGFFGFDDSTSRMVYIPDATNSSEVFSGNRGNIEAAGMYVTTDGSTVGIQIGVSSDTEIDTAAGNLTIDSAGGTTTIDDACIVTGDLTIGNGTDGTDYTLTFDGHAGDGVLTWMEDEDYFKFSDDVLMNSTERLNFGDTGTYINQSGDAALAVVSDGTVTVDAGTDIVLDADGDDITFKAGSADSTGLKFTQSNTGDWTVLLGTSDKDLIFNVNDGGVATEVCRLDGDVSALKVASSKKLMLGAAEEYMYGDGTDIHFGVGSGGDINIPADIGVTFGHATGDKIEGDGSSMTITSQEFTVDSAGDIILDADGGEVFFEDAGVQQGVLKMDTSSKFILSSSLPANDVYLMSGKDIVFDADDGGISFKDDGTEQLAIDMAGTAGQIDIQLKVDSDDLVFKQFDGSEVIRIADDRRLYFYDQGGEYISSDGTDLSIAAGTAINILAGTIDSSNQAVAWTPATSETAINIASGQFNVDTDNKRIGIGTTTVETPLHVQSASAPQVRVGYDATHFADFSMNNTHDLTIKPSSTGQIILQPTTDTTDFFQVLDANGGTSILQVDATNEMVGVGIDPPLVALDVHYKQAPPTSLANDTGGGEVVYFGGGTTTAGKLYYLDAEGDWTATDADSVDNGAESMLAIALGTAPGTHGMLVRGWFDVHSYLSNFESGMAVYASTTAGQMDTESPSGCGDYVRIVGHCTNTANAIYFNPSAVWVEIATS